MKRQTRQLLLLGRGCVEVVFLTFVTRWLIDLVTDKYPALHDRIWAVAPTVAGLAFGWLFARRFFQAKALPPDQTP
jgi:hypothetical protein